MIKKHVFLQKCKVNNENSGIVNVFNNVQMSVLKGAWETNLRVRPERDWEQLKGRAVSIDTDE